MQDGPAYNHFGYMQDSNPTNRKPNPNPLTLTATLADSLIRINQGHHPRKSPLCFQKIYNNFRWSATALRCPANSQNWQIVQDSPAYNQCVVLIYCPKNSQ